MRFYNVDMRGKFWNQRGPSDPATNPSNEGRLFYNETEEILKLHNSSGWDDVVTASKAISIIGSDFLRKDQADSTPFTLGVGALNAATSINGGSVSVSGLAQSASLAVTGSSATINGNAIWHAGNDGPGSGLNADLLDSHDSSYYRNANNMNAGTLPVARLSGTYNINITGTANNADLLDSKDSSFYRNASNMNTGTLPAARLSGTYNISITGSARYA